MTTKIHYDNTGRITAVLSGGGSFSEGNVLEVSDPVSIGADTHYVQKGRLIAIPPRPSINHSFDYALKEWVDLRTLDERKAEKWEEIKAAREAAEFGGFTWDGSTFDSDELSQQRIAGAVQFANLNPTGFVIDWTLADNTVRTLNAQEMTAVGVAMGQHVNAQHAKARLLRQQIEAATTEAELDVIVW